MSSLGSATMPSGKSGKSRTIGMRGWYARPGRSYHCDARSTAIVWFRRDLRVHDHPALTGAARSADRVVPVFVLDEALLHGRFESGPRARFLLGCLRALRAALRDRGANLVVRAGARSRCSAAGGGDRRGRCTSPRDVSAFAMARDRRVEDAMADAGVEVVRHPGLFVADVGKPRTKGGKPYSVFSPFWRAWTELDRREVHGAPRKLVLPAGVAVGEIPSPDALGLPGDVPEPFPPGEAAARVRMYAWLPDGIAGYADHHDRLEGGTSELSPYLHFGCISRARARAARPRRRPGRGAGRVRAPARLARLLRARAAEQPGQRAPRPPARDGRARVGGRRRGLRGVARGADRVPAWSTPGCASSPPAGWIHNRARLIVASFLTKDLHIDWRRGEAHFMRLLADGDEASNNGNWQWITSIGVDPAPYFRRMYNPATQQQRHDPDGAYVRRWVPELRDVPLERLAEPWTMTGEEQEAAGCAIGRDYPEPIVDHKRERERAMARYRAVRSGA